MDELQHGRLSDADQNHLEEQLQLLSWGKLKSPTPELVRELEARRAEGSWPLPKYEYELWLKEREQKEQVLRHQNLYGNVPTSRYLNRGRS